MAALETLPPDQRAVLQMMLEHGQGYEEIAETLSLEPEAVRERARAALEALTPTGVAPGVAHGLVGDYLLGQLSDDVATQVYALLERSDGDRAWARAVAHELERLASRSLPEIPVGARDSSGSPPSSRRGGAILLGSVGALIVAAIAVAVATSGAEKSPRGARHGGSGAATQTATQTGTIATSTAPAPHVLAQLNLKSPTGSASTVGIVLVERVEGVTGIVIDAEGVPANTANNAYGVWLYNSPSSNRFVGFAPTLVGKNGKLVTEGTLKPWATHYHHLLITLQTQRRQPATPGRVVLSGPFRER